MSEPPAFPPILDDLPTGQDALDFTPYVDALAGILLDPATRTPLTLGIFGAWGSGKTSLMTMLRDRVLADHDADGKPRHRAVWFNAWKYDKEEALWRALLLVLLDDLEGLVQEHPPEQKKGEPSAAELLERLREALYRDTAWAEKGKLEANWTQAAGAAGGVAFNLLLSGLGLGLAADVLEEARKSFGKGEPVSQVGRLAGAFHRKEQVHYQSQLRSLEQFQQNFSDLVRLLLAEPFEKPRCLMVFVDDLDRCAPEKALQVLEALKLFLDAPGCVYVLGLDSEAIEAAVRDRYHDEVKAREYLEKIIQLPFILPPIQDEAMQDYVRSLVPKDSLPDERCAEVFALGLTHNPRQVKRTINIFLLLTRLVQHRPALRGAIKPVRLAKVVIIQQAHRELYAELDRRPGYLQMLETYCRRAPGEAARREGAVDELASLPERLQEIVRGDREGALARLLCLLEEEDARFAGLSLDEIRSYITLTRQAAPAPAAAPAVRTGRLHFEPELVPVAAGPFLMGTSDEQIKAMLKHYDWARQGKEKALFADEQPPYEVTLPAFEIGRYPVTNAEYAVFVEAAGRTPPSHWQGGRLPEGQADHPVTYVSWRDALAYVDWLAETVGQPYRLPTEAEWEKAARGDDGRLWPWGSDWVLGRANCKPAGPGTTTPVGQYSPGGDSPYGGADMAGNVWEWCSSLFRPYPYRTDDGREGLEGGKWRVIRGGSWYDDNPVLVRCAFRYEIDPVDRNVRTGFRVARESSR